MRQELAPVDRYEYGILHDQYDLMAYSVAVGIDHGSPVPVYVQFAEILRAQITTDFYGPGAALPTEDNIGRIHRVGRMSVRRA